MIPLFYDRDADGVPQGWCDKVKQALDHLRPGLHRDAHAARLRRAHVPGSCTTSELTSCARRNGELATEAVL